MLTADGLVAGTEIGARGCRVALAGPDGVVVAQRSNPLAQGGPSAVIDAVCDALAAILRESGARPERLLRLATGFAGAVDTSSGVVLASPRLDGWESLPLASLLEERLGIPVLVDNDARVAALGEARFGAGRGEQHLAYVHLGHGLGGGLVLDGRLYRGATATAGEIGHVLVDENGPLCSCGKPGHLEAYASATAIVQRAIERATQGPAAGSLQTRLTAGEAPSLLLIFEAARDGDPAASTVVQEAIHFLAVALANLVTTISPAVIVVGGRVADVGPLFFEPLRAQVRRYAMAVPARAVRIVPAALGADGIITGAVALALQSLEWDAPSSVG